VLHAYGLGPGDEVITVSHSFIATANAIAHTGATPVFVDISLDDFNMDLARIADAITPATRAIVAVHQIGMPCRISAISALAKERGLRLIEDAACAVGSEILTADGTWRRIGTPIGDVACFSFHPRKIITTGDGGMVTTSDTELAVRLRRLRQHGMTISDLARNSAPDVIFETYDEIGFNYRMTDIQAAIGREQLKRLDDFIAERRRLADNYVELLCDVPGVVVPVERADVRSNWQSFCVLLPEHSPQREVMQYMMAREISTRRGVMCAHREIAYSDYLKPHDLKCSEYVQDHGVILPLYVGLRPHDQARVRDVLAGAITEYQNRAA
jgi:dTDP-4-amino-4,6-dideoxygalactose transaminase